MSTASETQARHGYTVAPGLETQVRIKTLPMAKCTVGAAEGSGSSPTLLAYADTDGFLDLHVRALAEPDASVALVIDAEAEGDRLRHFLELRVGWEPSDDMPAPPAPPERWRPRSDAKLVPALSQDELLRVEDEELVKRGYPPRPDPRMAPSAFNAWRRHVSAPVSLLEPRQVSRPDITHRRRAAISDAPATSGSWSGYELRGPAGTYDWVSGEWIVPNVTGADNTVTYSSFWIGLDGDGTPDLVQAGTEQQNTTIFIPFQGTLSVSTYYAWTEFLPQQAAEQQLTNFPIHAGDQIFLEVFVANAGQMPSLNGAFGVAWFMNMTTSTSTNIYTPRGATAVGGSEAEWIMERPTVNSAFAELANYGAATMSHAYARQPNGAYVGYAAANNEQITMVNGPNTLSSVFPVDATTMVFLWQASH